MHEIKLAFSLSSMAFVILWLNHFLVAPDLFFPLLWSNSDKPVVSAANQDGVFYLSPSGNGEDGLSWDSAWSSPDRIDWNRISTGSTLMVDSGTYSGVMKVDVDGVVIKLGRGDQAVFQGRASDIPGCGSSIATSSDVPYIGITIFSDGVTIDGVVPRGIAVRGFIAEGIRLDRTSSNATIKNVAVFQNGSYDGKTRRGTGIRVGGPEHKIVDSVIHDNGQDAIMSLHGSDNNLGNLLIDGVRVYYENKDHYPCTHADGVQIYSGGAVDGVKIANSVFGPNLTNGIILGQTGSVERATVSSVVIENVLMFGLIDNAIISYTDSGNASWTIRGVTADCMGAKNCLALDARPLFIRDSIFVNGNLFAPGASTGNNCQWNTTGAKIGEDRDPRLDDGYEAQDTSCVGYQSSEGFRPIGDNPCDPNG